ncbi:MAG: RlmE family RNA methyltransferase [Spirochaetaceae bacterium]|jgi:23S rRNA (uridine2552-2'-O)-methyltransferase|nr:RlmE family RNA methyltransferase [Spirochaetaceae bacterium]
MAENYEKPDFWAKKAASQGYPARSVYKLMEIDKKFALLKPGQRVLDLGAAPGSWTLYVSQVLNGNGHLTAVDLRRLKKIPESGMITMIEGDMTAEDVRFRARDGGLYDVVLSDAAPETTGNRLVDTTRSGVLVDCALFYADTLLKAGGNLVVKIFQGSDSGALLRQVRARFASGRTYKPTACRSASFETYIIGLGKLA